MDETKRLSLLQRYDILDTPPEAAFDHIVEIAARILGMPITLVSLVDEARVWFKARHGMQYSEIVRLPGFCASAIEQDGPWLIEDAANDPRCARHPWVTGDAQVRSYAGIPLKMPEGRCLGTLCAMDTKPRRLEVRERETLSELAALVVDKLISRSASKAALWEKDVAVGVAGELADQSRLLTAMVQSSQDAIITKDLAGRITSWNSAAERMFGFSEAEMMGQSGLRIIPADRHAEENFVLSSIAEGQSVNHYETVRQHRSGRQIPISISISPIWDDHGRVIGASKIARDITDRKDSQERINALMKEVNHRVKNQYAVIISMLRQTGKTTRTRAEFEGRIRERIMALSRSHDLLVNADWRGITIEDLVASQIEPFANRGRVSSQGPSSRSPGASSASAPASMKPSSTISNGNSRNLTTRPSKRSSQPWKNSARCSSMRTAAASGYGASSRNPKRSGSPAWRARAGSSRTTGSPESLPTRTCIRTLVRNPAIHVCDRLLSGASIVHFR